MTSLDGLRALEQAASPGPWSTRGVTIRQGLGVTEPSYGPIATTYDSEADAEFIAEARNALPGLLGRVEAAEAELAALRFAFAVLVASVPSGPAAGGDT